MPNATPLVRPRGSPHLGGTVTYAILCAALALTAVSAAHVHYAPSTGVASSWMHPAAHASPPVFEHPPPMKQHVSPSEVQCNEPRDLYIAGVRPLCLFPDTYEILVSRGVDLVRGTVHALDLTSEEEAWLLKNPVVRVSYDPHWFPIEYTDESGNLAGATKGYMAEFERITGIDFQQADTADWTRALESIRERSSDVIFMVTPVQERLEYMGFTATHYVVETSLVTAEEAQLDMGMEGLRILTVRDYSIEAWLDENHPEIEYVSVDGPVQGLEILREGGADAFAIAWPVALGMAEMEDMDIYNAGPTGHSHHLSIGYRSDQPVLGSMLQKVLDSIPQSTLEQLQGAAIASLGQD